MPVKRDDILIIAPSVTHSIGGIENYCQQVAHSVQNSNCQFKALTMNPEITRERWLFSAGAIPKLFRKAFFVMLAFYLMARFRPKKILVLHLNFLPLATLFNHLAQSKLYTFLYGIEAWSLTPSKASALKNSYEILAISQYTADKVECLIGKKPKLIPCTYDETSYFYPSNSSATIDVPGLLPKHKVILTVARLSSEEGYKGVEQVIALMPQLIEWDESVRYVIGGAGDQIKALKKLSDQLGVSDYVMFTGFVPKSRMPDLYHGSKVFVLPSVGEGFGIVLLEALACGTPAVGYDAGGIKEALGQGKLGFLVEPKDSEQLLATIKNIIANNLPNDNRCSAEWLSSEVKQQFGIERFQSKVNQIILSHE